MFIIKAIMPPEKSRILLLIYKLYSIVVTLSPQLSWSHYETHYEILIDQETKEIKENIFWSK